MIWEENSSAPLPPRQGCDGQSNRAPSNGSTTLPGKRLDHGRPAQQREHPDNANWKNESWSSIGEDSDAKDDDMEAGASLTMARCSSASNLAGAGPDMQEDAGPVREGFWRDGRSGEKRSERAQQQGPRTLVPSLSASQLAGASSTMTRFSSDSNLAGARSGVFRPVHWQDPRKTSGRSPFRRTSSGGHETMHKKKKMMVCSSGKSLCPLFLPTVPPSCRVLAQHFCSFELTGSANDLPLICQEPDSTLK